MANTLQGMKTAMKGFSFIDWDGLTEDEYQQLDKIINNPSACSGVKLPFCLDRAKCAEGEERSSSSSHPKKQQSDEMVRRNGSNSSSSRENTVFQPNLPPPPHQPPLPSGVPPVVAYPVPVHHWAHNAPHPPPSGATPFPMSIQGGYVFPNQPPPPLVTNGDAATMAFVAAMSSGQPVYAIPGVPLQSIHNHYTGTSGYPQVEPIDLSVPVVAQQPVTVHHFVQPEGIVFTHAPTAHHVPVPLAQSTVAPGTNTVHHIPTQESQNLNNVEAELPYDSHQCQDNVTHDFHTESHIVHMPPDIDPTPLSLQEKHVKTLQQSETDKVLASKITKSPKSQLKDSNTSSKSLPDSSSPGVEFVGPVVFGLDSSNVSAKKPISNGISTVETEVSSMTVSNDLAKLNLSDNADTSSSNVRGSSVNVKSTQAVSVLPKGTKTEQVPISESSIPSNITSQSHADKVSATDTKDREENRSSVPSTSAQGTPQPQAPRMWSSLFGKPKASNPVSPTSPNPEPLVPVQVPNSVTGDEVKSVRYWQEQEQAEAKLKFSPTQKVIPVGVQNDPIAPKILDVLSSLPVVHAPLVIQPRGLVNGSNVCFMNATLQVLMGCPPFIHLFRAFKNLPPRQNSGSCTPIFDSLIEFVNSFHNGQRVKSQGSRNKKAVQVDVNVGQPFSPTSLLSVAQDILGLRIGIQHDAEEFLSKILMICHEELENILKLNQTYGLNNNGKMATNNGHVTDSPVDGDIDGDDDESWQKVGPKNHHVETNVNDCGQTPLSSIFSGLSRSCLTRETGKNSDTLDSFFTLKLDIQGENVHNVTDALQRLNVSETLLDIDGGKIQGQRRMFFDVLPPVLIMHLKLFQYSDGNGKKIQKKIDFDVDLTIPKETLSRVGKNKYMSSKSRSYKLFGVVNHHGLKMTDGHYTSDVFLPIASGWLRFDDSEVYAIQEKQVLQHSERHMPYLLFYRRMDVS